MEPPGIVLPLVSDHVLNGLSLEKGHVLCLCDEVYDRNILILELYLAIDQLTVLSSLRQEVDRVFDFVDLLFVFLFEIDFKLFFGENIFVSVPYLEK